MKTRSERGGFPAEKKERSLCGKKGLHQQQRRREKIIAASKCGSKEGALEKQAKRGKERDKQSRNARAKVEKRPFGKSPMWKKKRIHETHRSSSGGEPQGERRKWGSSSRKLHMGSITPIKSSATKEGLIHIRGKRVRRQRP